jgi:hypothetical protein
MTSLLLNDDLSMNRMNPYTATDTFGIVYNGGYKGVLEPAPERPESPPMLEFNPRAGVPTDHFDTLALDHAANMYLGTGSVNPARTFLYPARKYQFDDGSTTFGRGVVLADAKNYITPADFADDFTTGRTLLIVAMIMLLILLVLQRGRIAIN